MTVSWRCWLACGLALVQFGDTVAADEPKPRPQRLLLLGQKPDGHPRATHEYLPGVQLLAGYLQKQPGLQTILVSADHPWPDGPELLDSADGVVLFLSEGARWIREDKKRLAAFKRLAARRGGLVGLHWAIGTRKAENIADFLALVGGCHGGPDRKYKVVETLARTATPGHPVLSGIKPFEVRDEFYYRLKFTRTGKLVPLLTVAIDGSDHHVAWAWTRPDRGRSFGFSGLHFHENWRHEPYRRMVLQAVLWTLKRPVPKGGIEVPLTGDTLKLPQIRKPKS